MKPQIIQVPIEEVLCGDILGEGQQVKITTHNLARGRDRVLYAHLYGPGAANLLAHGEAGTVITVLREL